MCSILLEASVEYQSHQSPPDDIYDCAKRRFTPLDTMVKRLEPRKWPDTKENFRDIKEIRKSSAEPADEGVGETFGCDKDRGCEYE